MGESNLLYVCEPGSDRLVVVHCDDLVARLTEPMRPEQPPRLGEHAVASECPCRDPLHVLYISVRIIKAFASPFSRLRVGTRAGRALVEPSRLPTGVESEGLNLGPR